ncbi:unnamed protein product [Victoria cruziana]
MRDRARSRSEVQQRQVDIFSKTLQYLYISPVLQVCL